LNKGLKGVIVLNVVYLVAGIFASSFIAYLIIQFSSGGSVFVGPLTGAVIATGITMSFNCYLRAEEKKASRKTLINTLIADLNVFRYFIKLRVKAFEEANNPLGYVYLIDDYFIVFEQNANKIGSLPKDIATEILNVYFSIKGLFDTIRGNSEENKQIQLQTKYLTKMQMTLSPDELLASHEFQAAFNQYKIDTEAAEKNYDILIKDHCPKALKKIESLLTKLTTL